MNRQGLVTIAAGALVALALVYFADRIAGRMSGDLAAYNARVDSMVEDQVAFRERTLDSMQAIVDSALARADSFQGVAVARGWRVRALRDSARVLTQAAQLGPIEGVLGQLGMRGTETGLFVIDSAGARVLAGLVVEAQGSRPLIEALDDQVAALEAERDELRLAIFAAGAVVDSLEARNLALENLLVEGQKVRGCSIAGLFPCPSRTVVAIVAGVAGATAGVLAASGK